ncbi:IS110 family transposase [Sinorhizobium alkalisoli]|uniref:Transposase n=1 Tax=Sinorhizobium alkalisoli TaxID=1752398 RepID=A0A1E3VI14_9HYPH|nr:IS110 family transposase [Sinorhizobium alkalisoli]ODR93087.1 transposase [Sinorhizobium alkalisoli]QFI70540.1 Mobile element protein [Sinorhizobium alkalisoli]
MERMVYVGLDVHAETIAVATADDGRNGDVRFYGIIENNADSVLRLTKRLSAAGARPVFCYEAGPCGYGLYRLLTKLGFDCAVVAPAMIPRRAGDRVKTDRRDAEMLARLWRAGELTPIWTPDEEQEAMRDLIRTRKQALEALKIAKQQLLSFLLRHGLRYERPTYWTKMHWRWINELRKFRYPHQQIAFEELKRAIRQIEERIRTLDLAIEDAVKPWRFAPVVDALRALRGVNTMIAATLAAEIGDISRFSNPRQLMAWLGLVPSEHSSGSTTRRGRITRTGNALARTMMVEASWSYRHPPRERHLHLKRSQHLPHEIRDIGWKAQTRLCKRYRDLSRTGKPQPRVLTAIARELAGFIWDIARKTPLSA